MAIALAILPTAIGVMLFSVGSAGAIRQRLNLAERIVFVLSGILLIEPAVVTDVIGVAAGAVTLYLHNLRVRKA